MDLARSWMGAPALGGELLAREKDGRGPCVTLLSARDLSCSDQLKPCWSDRATLSEGMLCVLKLLACGRDVAMPMLARRLAARVAATLGLRMGCCAGGGEDGLLLPLPGLPPGRYPLTAEPPKLMRRVKGVVGAVLAPASSSSIAFSSIESELLELVDMLPRRIPSEAAPLCEAPDNPSVVTDRRRRFASAAVALGGPGKAGPVLPDGGPRWNRLDRAACVMELRRCRGFSVLGPSVDILCCALFTD